jgi:hypothetical protein
MQSFHIHAQGECWQSQADSLPDVLLDVLKLDTGHRIPRLIFVKVANCMKKYVVIW